MVNSVHFYVHVPLFLSYKPFEEHEKTHKEIKLSEASLSSLKSTVKRAT